MKTIVRKKDSVEVDISSISSAFVQNKIVVIHQGESMGILSHNFGCNIKDRRLFFTPLKFHSSDGHFWDGCAKTEDVNEFLSIFVGRIGAGTQIHIFDTHLEFASWLQKQKINESNKNENCFD